MHTLKTLRIVGIAAVAATLPALLAIAAHAQSPSPSTAPGMVKPVTPGSDMDADVPKAGSATPKQDAPSLSPPVDKSASPSAAPTPGKNADTGGATGAAATVKDVTVGSAVFGSDGQKIGEVKGVKVEPGGKVEEIHVKTGGVLGFGGKIVVIPGAKIAKGGQTIQVTMTTEEVGKLPALVENNKG